MNDPPRFLVPKEDRHGDKGDAHGRDDDHARLGTPLAAVQFRDRFPCFPKMAFADFWVRRTGTASLDGDRSRHDLEEISRGP